MLPNHYSDVTKTGTVNAARCSCSLSLIIESCSNSKKGSKGDTMIINDKCGWD